MPIESEKEKLTITANYTLGNQAEVPELHSAIMHSNLNKQKVFVAIKNLINSP